MNNNLSPEDFVKTLPVASTAPHDISHGITPLPPTALLSEAERLRLEKMAANGEQPVERAPADKEQELNLYEDGSCTKHCARPGSYPQRIIVDGAGRHLAITKDEVIADWICNACNLMVIASKQAESEGRPLQIMHTPIVLPEQ